MHTDFINENAATLLSLPELFPASNVSNAGTLMMSFPGDDDDENDEDGDWSDIDDEDFEDIAEDREDLHQIELDNNIFDDEDDDHLPDDD